MVATRAIKATAHTAPDSTVTQQVLAALHDTGAHIELHAPHLADGPLVAVLDAADRLLTLVVTGRPTPSVIKEAEHEFDEAVQHLRAGMREDLGIG